MPKHIGIIVAADVPHHLLPQLQDGALEPVALVMRYRNGRGSDQQLPVRDLEPDEIVSVVNRALKEGRLEYGFRVPQAPGLITPGRM